jgi:hypothetical protein
MPRINVKEIMENRICLACAVEKAIELQVRVSDFFESALGKRKRKI